jgi:hypothetical protein
MGHFSTRWNSLAVVLALATMLGCQGLSTSKPSSQGPQNPVAGALSASPASITFGNVQIGTSQTQSGTLSNTGGTSITITQATVTGTGFSATGLNLPLTLATGQSTTFSIVFSPQSSGSATGNLALTNDGPSSPLNIALSGTAVAAGSLSANPTSFSFGIVQVGANQTQTETLNNSGGENVTITQATVTGAGFSYTGLNLPLTLAPNQSTTFGVVFAPASASPINGSLSLTISESSTTLDMALSGVGVTVTPSQGTLSVSPVNVGNVTVGTSGTQTGTLNATGASVSVSSVNLSGTNPSEFSVSGLSFPVTVTTSQPVSFTVNFTPGATGAASATVSFGSNAAGSPNAATLAGTGMAAPVHSVSLSWTASTTSGITSYNVYRAVYATNSCGSYSNIGSAPSSSTVFTDSVVADGTTYCYATTAVDAGGESGYSNIAQAAIPAP